MLTDTAIKGLKPKKSPYRVWDMQGNGFGLQVTPKGAKSFFQFYNVPQGYADAGKRRFLTIGRYPALTLKQARDKSEQIRSLLAQGIDPKEHAQAEANAREKAAREARMRGSVGQLFDAYVAELESNHRPATAKKVKETLERDAIPVLGADTKAKDVTPEDIRLVLHRVIKRGAMYQANRLYSYLRRAFQVGMEHDFSPANLDAPVLFGLQFNPVRDVPKPMKSEKPRDRTLDWWEIAAIWKALDRSPMYPETACLLRLSYLLGGQRFEELRAAPWKEFDLQNGRWDIPGKRTKNGRPHLVPITSEAKAELEWLHALTGHTKLLFPNRNNPAEPMPSATPAQAARNLQKMMAKEHEANPDESPLLDGWQPRDCRGTVKTRLAELGIQRDIRNQLQNHAVTSDVAGKHYDRFDYFDEKHRAMEAFVARLFAEIKGRVLPSNVAKLA